MATENQRDLILAEGQYAFIQDQTKGHIGVYTGPYKTSIAGTDVPVKFVLATGRFDKCSLEEAIQEAVLATEGSYVVLTNPAQDGSKQHPETGNLNRIPLNQGRKVMVRGPASFALWPGQHAQVIEGHRLRSNQYLVARVYNDDEAKKNWNTALLRPATAASESEPSAATATPESPKTRSPEFIMGQKLIIKGTEVSFFIPPTGIEVEADETGKYVREAVTLERLEYCLLLGENGKKRYVRGPDVVFTEPTETFVERDGQRKFRAVELNEDMGIHIKVIANYEEGGKQHVAGEELFITGREQRIYYPREEHAVVKYGDADRVYGTVIPKGEARYVLDKAKGDIGLKEGPMIFLADPRKETIVRRALTPQQVSDWFPGNAEAEAFNARLRQDSDGASRGFVPASPKAAVAEALIRSPLRGASESFQRGTEYTPPRSITIDPRFDGAVQISPYIGFAVLVLGKSGNRRVVIGPDSTILAFDEILQVLTLSTGKPKSSDRLLRTVYLTVSNNQVSDFVHVVTKDMVQADLKVSYRVNFVGDTPEERLRWFSVPNYVKFLCDHLRSMLRSACKRVGIEELNENAAGIVRDTILGVSPGPGERRLGRRFEENGMHVYDVEILDVVIGDAEISRVLVDAQHRAVAEALSIGQEERKLAVDRRRQEILREQLLDREKTAELQADIQQKAAERELAAKLEKLAADFKTADQQRKLETENDVHRTKLSESELARVKAARQAEQEAAERKAAMELSRLVAEAEAHVKRFNAVSPEFIAALNAFGQSMLATEASKALGPLALLGGESVADVLHRVFKDTKFAAVVEALKPPTNGAAKAATS